MIALLVISFIMFCYMIYVLLKPEKFWFTVDYSLFAIHQIMNTEIIGVISIYVLTLALAYLLGKYIARFFRVRKLFLIPYSIHSTTFSSASAKLILWVRWIGKKAWLHYSPSISFGFVRYARDDEHGLASAESGWKSFHACWPGIQHSGKFCFEHQPSALLGRNGSFLSRAIDSSTLSIHQRWCRHGGSGCCFQCHERKNSRQVGELLQLLH